MLIGSNLLIVVAIRRTVQFREVFIMGAGIFSEIFGSGFRRMLLVRVYLLHIDTSNGFHIHQTHCNQMWARQEDISMICGCDPSSDGEKNAVGSRSS